MEPRVHECQTCSSPTLSRIGARSRPRHARLATLPLLQETCSAFRPTNNLYLFNNEVVSVS